MKEVNLERRWAWKAASRDTKGRNKRKHEKKQKGKGVVITKDDQYFDRKLW